MRRRSYLVRRESRIQNHSLSKIPGDRHTGYQDSVGLRNIRLAQRDTAFASPHNILQYHKTLIYDNHQKRKKEGRLEMDGWKEFSPCTFQSNFANAIVVGIINKNVSLGVHIH